jgi:hypothetical protein
MGLLRKRGEPGFFVEHSGFLGSLESAIEEEVILLGAYREMAARAGQLRAAYSAGRISAEEYGSTIAGLRVKGSDGKMWTIGTTTGRWYVRNADLHDGETSTWEPATPPNEHGTLVDPDGIEIGWAAETETADVANMVFTAYTGGDVVKKPSDETTDSTNGSVQVADMFGAYVEQVGETSAVSGILVVDELDGDDSWKKRYFDLRPEATFDDASEDDNVNDDIGDVADLGPGSDSATGD